MSRTLRIGHLGAGYWGPNLLRAMAAAPGVQIVAICDANEARLSPLQRLYPEARLTTSMEEVLQNPDIDAVVVALPVALHYQAVKAVFDAGKHCLVEKPLALSSRDARELVETAERKRLTLMVGHTFEYNDAVRKIKSYIDSGELGSIYNILSQRMNLGQIREDVDVLWNLAPHDISIALHWLDGRMPIAVRAQGFTHLPRSQIMADIATLTLEFDTGTICHVLVSWLCPERVRKIHVVGSKKMVVYDDVNVEARVQIFDKGVAAANGGGGFGEFQLQVRTGDLLIPKLQFVEPLRRECDHFVECVLTGARPLSDGASGLRIVRILEAATQSIAEDGRRIRLSEGAS